MTDTASITAEQLEQELDVHLQSGELGSAGISAWLLSQKAPKNGVWKVAAKKVLRESGVSGATAAQLLQTCDDAMKTRDFYHAFAALCLGLLMHPGHVGLLTKLIDLARQHDQDLLLDAALGALPTETNDPALLHLKAARAHEAGDYAQSEELFRKLLAQRPDAIDLRFNLSAALTGLERYEEAIALLEKCLVETEHKKDALFKLMPLYRRRTVPTLDSLTRVHDDLLANAHSAEGAKVKGLVLSYLERPTQAIDAYKESLTYADTADTRFHLSLVQLRAGEYKEGFTNYLNRFACFADMQWLQPPLPRYDGRTLEEETLLVWAEQGVGDEVFFAFPLLVLKRRVKHVVLAVDARLRSFFEARFPEFDVISRDEAKARVSSQSESLDFEIPMGELMPLFFGELQALPATERHPLFQPVAHRLDEIKARIGNSGRPSVAISWRGGTDLDGKARSMTLADMIAALGPEADVDIISVQYSGDVGREITELNDPRVRLSGLNDRDDLEGILTLLSQVDHVVSVDNAVVHFAAAVGTPVQLIMPRALSQFRFKNEDFRGTCFPGVQLHYQSLDGDWREPTHQAWRAALGG